MDDEVLYGSVSAGSVYLDYYIIPENISAHYCDLKCYGIRIEKTSYFEGGGKIIESRQINNVFYRYADACEFVAAASEKMIEPERLGAFVEKYVTESIDRARQKV